MSEQEQPGEFDPEYSNGGIIRSSDGDTVLAWISPGEEYFTAAQMRRLRHRGLPEGDSGEIPE